MYWVFQQQKEVIKEQEVLLKQRAEKLSDMAKELEELRPLKDGGYRKEKDGA